MSLSYWTLRLDSMLKSSRLSYKGCYVGSELDGHEFKLLDTEIRLNVEIKQIELQRVLRWVRVRRA